MGKFYALSQYKAPYNYELAGKHFHIVMDNGVEYSMFFMDGENVQYAKKGEAYVYDTYECLKGNDTTYLVWIQPAKEKGRLNFAIVLDVLQNLVTFVKLEGGLYPQYPNLVHVEPFFGAIKLPGRELPKIRHHLTDRMVGGHIVWKYGPGHGLQHIYHAANCVRASGGPGVRRDADAMRQRMAKELESADPETRKAAEERIKSFEERAKWYPFYDEECFHVWISDTMNLFCFLEENMLYASPENKEGGGGILLLQDIDRVIDVGLSFDTKKPYMLSAYGEENDIPDPLDDKESPYDWSLLQAMPSIHWEVPKDE